MKLLHNNKNGSSTVTSVKSPPDDFYFQAVQNGLATVQKKPWAAKMLNEFNDIHWTEQTFNAAWGCTKVSPGLSLIHI